MPTRCHTNKLMKTAIINWVTILMYNIIYIYIFELINFLVFFFRIGITNKMKLTSEGFNEKNNKINNNHL